MNGEMVGADGKKKKGNIWEAQVRRSVTNF